VSRAMEIRIRGRVQGVGFRPTVWRFARELRLNGEVFNDAEGVMVRAGGEESAIAAFVARISSEPPPLARIESIETAQFDGALPTGFRICESSPGDIRTEISPDAAVCEECAAEIADPSQRRFRYPFTNCTHCGPRLTIIAGAPYDRAQTAMEQFPLCDECRAEYTNPGDRRFHAEAIACRACGPQARLIRLDGGELIQNEIDDVEAAGRLIRGGEIIAVKGLGGYHLACDARNEGAVARLRQLKRRDAKPFALMARDIEIIRSYCSVSAEEEEWLKSAAAPIVLLRASGPGKLPDAIAPGVSTLGFMLPYTPLHLLLLQDVDRPVVMTSGNYSDEPQVTADAEAREKLSGIASHALVHNREILNRVDDSVVRLAGGAVRVLRRARGFAPAPVKLPKDFFDAPELLAFGGELKATFCLLKNGEAILSQHQGDLENAETFAGYELALGLYEKLFNHKPKALTADKHPEYLSSKLAHERARADGLPLIEAQHHHAHIAACLAENGRSLHAPPVLGVVLDGLGWGDDGTFWGGEFLLADYSGYRRLGAFKPVGMPGGAQAVKEPWRNLYAHLNAEMGWPEFSSEFSGLELHDYLLRKPRALIERMIERGINTPLASSCGRLFDAVAAALSITPDRQAYEGQAAMHLEAIADDATLASVTKETAYPFAIGSLAGGLPYIEPLGMWRALLADLMVETPSPLIAARFHKGLAQAILAMVSKLAHPAGTSAPLFDTVALSGGCFQNRILFEAIAAGIERAGFSVLSHSQIPANDGGIALGQAVIAASHLIVAKASRTKEMPHVSRNSRPHRPHR
jgi:hydrogenase maturation protein HypF